METCFSSDGSESPLPCTIVLHDNDHLGPGTIWAFYPGRCHVESEVPIGPDMDLPERGSQPSVGFLPWVATVHGKLVGLWSPSATSCMTAFFGTPPRALPFDVNCVEDVSHRSIQPTPPLGDTSSVA